jgi:hypothetical protein
MSNEIKREVQRLINQRNGIDDDIKDIICNYAISKGIIPKGSSPDSIPYKKIIREQLGIVI